MLRRLILAVLGTVLVGCASLDPGEFSEALPGHVQASPDARDVAGNISAQMPAALHLVESRVGRTPQHFTVLVCRSDCFAQHVPIPGAAAAQLKNRVFVNADLVQPDQIPAVLAHELTHVLIQEQRGQDLHKVPEWANEGLAVWVSGVGTEGCANATEHMRQHPICRARVVSAWLDGLAAADPQVQRCWVDQMITGIRNTACPDTGSMRPQW